MENEEKNKIDSSVFLNLLLVNIENVEEKLNELINSQIVTLETIEIENGKYSADLSLNEIRETVNKSKIYSHKISNLKKEIASLSEKAQKLKVRASKLEKYRENVLNEKILQKEKQEHLRKKLVVTFSK